MRRFDLLEPRSLQDACAALASEAEAKPIAGGTALLAMIRQGWFSPKTLVNLHKVRDASAISFDSNRGLRIGALATIDEIEISPVVRERCPIFAEACHDVANIRIRNMATIGGNLAHADSQSDPPTALVALDASVELKSWRATRQMKLADFLLGSYQTALEPGELVSAVLIPPLPADMKGSYIKFTSGSSEERPCAGVAALTWMENGVCRELRLAVGAVSPRPVRVAAGERMAREQRLTPRLIEDIAAEAARSADPIDDLRGPADYKRHLVRVLVRRAIAALAGENWERESCL
ncbi:MAG TPA: xanthine dehydrogenase family protein subunit M [Methylomirabilota bacterium]|nr:xanthine dehydrogenase family protein subunit M [Methylomirabilota bacterium]